MKGLQLALAGMIAVVVGIVGGGLLLPDRLQVERSIIIERPPATVFTVLDGFRHLASWSHWAELDPALEVELSGPVLGPGAGVNWRSSVPSIGSGSLVIELSEPYELIELSQHFEGRDAPTRLRYRMQPQGQGTRLDWTYEASFGFDLASRYVGWLVGDSLGADYQRGLDRLRAHVETLPATDFSGAAIELTEVPARTIAYWSGRSGLDAAAIARAYEQAYARVTAALQRDGVEPAGPVLAIGRRWDVESGVYEFDAAIPVADATRLTAAAGVRLGRTYAGKVLKAVHRGGDGTLQDHLTRLMAFKRAAGFVDNGSPWDVYVSDPATTGASERVVETYVPVR